MLPAISAATAVAGRMVLTFRADRPAYTGKRSRITASSRYVEASRRMSE
jgi:hypothetical protein